MSVPKVEYVDPTDAEAQAERLRLIRLGMRHPTAPYMKAGRASKIPSGDAGLWQVRKPRCNVPIRFNNGEICPAGQFTKLLRLTNATVHRGIGECVMSDDPRELSQHLQAAMTAFGNVLVTGLGLGCVLRMLQANERVESITVVEISGDVIKLTWPYTSHDRVELIHADAFDFLKNCNGRRWDCAWHDIWSDADKEQPHLAILHQRLLIEATRVVPSGRQGAWKFPSYLKKIWRGLGNGRLA